jgi:hypothetical protein
MSGPDQVLRHRAAHDAEAEKSVVGHVVSPFQRNDAIP